MEQVAHSYDLPVEAVQEGLKLAVQTVRSAEGQIGAVPDGQTLVTLATGIEIE